MKPIGVRGSPHCLLRQRLSAPARKIAAPPEKFPALQQRGICCEPLEMQYQLVSGTDESAPHPKKFAVKISCRRESRTQSSSILSARRFQLIRIPATPL